MHSSGSTTGLAPTTCIWICVLSLLSSWSYGTYATSAVPGLVGPNLDSYNPIHSILQSYAHIFSPNTTIHFPNSPDFFNVTERWTTFDAPTFSAAIRPATEEDVVHSVKLATQFKIPFLAVAGRHGYTTTLRSLRNGLEIDLSQLDTIEIDKTSQTFTVGAGVRVSEIFDPLYDAGFDFQTGSAPCPSLIGVTLGGGVGRYQGVYGLIIDSLISVRLVTADGQLLDVSKDSYPDLFWAIRGAGANFGIITSATYQAHPLTDDGDNFLAEFVVTADQARQYFETVESMQPFPAPLSSIMLNVFDATSNQTQLLVEWVYKGREDDARKVLAPILELGLTVTAMEVVKWNVLITSAFGGNIFTSICADNVNRDLYSFNMKSYSADSFYTSYTKMQQYFANYPGGRNSALQFELFPNQAMAAVSSNETAFPWRDSTGYINFNLLFDSGDIATQDVSEALGQEIRELLSVGSGYPEVTAFVNYAHGDEKLDRIYGADKLPRLADLKKQWDPHGAFSNNNGLPSKYP